MSENSNNNEEKFVITCNETITRSSSENRDYRPGISSSTDNNISLETPWSPMLDEAMINVSSISFQEYPAESFIDKGYPLNRQYSSPPILDASPKSSRKCVTSSAAANLTPIIRNTAEVSPIAISPDSELYRMSIPLLSTTTKYDTKCLEEDRPGNVSADQILLTRIPRSFVCARDLRRARTLTTSDCNSQDCGLPRVQYQPSRDDSLTDIGITQPEELSAIFLNNENELGDGIPLENRQWSIPSLHLANGLDVSTDASYTDEEDDLWVGGNRLLEPIQWDEKDDVAIGDSISSRFNAFAGEKVEENPVKIIFPKKDPYEWLQQIPGEGILAEAASSKFLTRGPSIA